MKILRQKISREQGNVLIMTLTFGVILLVASAGYLVLVGTQKTVVTRSQTWNAALALAEAGVEEAMAQINASPGDFSANNWGASGTNYGPITRGLNGGSYSVLISGSSTPIIYSTGYTTVPVTGTLIARKVRVTTGQMQSVFNVAFAAVNNIQFNGNGVVTDSWNSHDPNKSTNGQYDSSKTGTNGNVASVQGLVNIGNHTINGSLYLGPTAVYAGGGTITGNIYNNYNVNFTDVTLPAGAGGWAIAAPVSTTTYTTNISSSHGVTTTNITSTSSAPTYDFTTPGNYILTSDAYPIVVEAGVTVTLNVTSTTFNPSNLEIHGGTSNSGTAVLYFNGPSSATIAGNTAIDASNRPENLWYYGLSSLTSITFSGNSTFVGVIYAPEASLTLNGGGNNIGLIGSSITKSATMNGHYDFHYDESLATNGISRGFIATSWQEL